MDKLGYIRVPGSTCVPWGRLKGSWVRFLCKNHFLTSKMGTFFTHRHEDKEVMVPENVCVSATKKATKKTVFSFAIFRTDRSYHELLPLRFLLYFKFLSFFKSHSGVNGFVGTESCLRSSLKQQMVSNYRLCYATCLSCSIPQQVPTQDTAAIFSF